MTDATLKGDIRIADVNVSFHFSRTQDKLRIRVYLNRHEFVGGIKYVCATKNGIWY